MSRRVIAGGLLWAIGRFVDVWSWFYFCEADAVMALDLEVSSQLNGSDMRLWGFILQIWRELAALRRLNTAFLYRKHLALPSMSFDAKPSANCA